MKEHLLSKLLKQVSDIKDSEDIQIDRAEVDESYSTLNSESISFRVPHGTSFMTYRISITTPKERK